MVDEIMEAQHAPIERTERSRDRTVEQKNDYTSLGGLLTELKSTVGDLATPSKFNRFKADSSHPDILNAAITGAVTPGNFEFEVRGLAQADKHLAFGFPDINETPVGFGHMGIESENGDLINIDINPGSTLQDVASSINENAKDFRAQIVNTGSAEDPFRLLVASTKTGAAAALHLDEDTTFLEFKNIKKGRDLDVMFDDVQVTGPENKLDKLLDGLSIDLKRAEPGTKVTLNVKPDIDSSVTSIKKFTDGFNQILEVATGSAGGKNGGKSQLSTSDSSVRTIIRRLQSSMSSGNGKDGHFASLSQIGISSNAKTGRLEVDEHKLESALTTNYDQVMELFSQTEKGEGIANRISSTLQGIMDPTHGVVKSHIQTLNREIETKDQDIARQTERMEKNRVRIERQFAAMDRSMGQMNQQSQFLSNRFDASGSDSASGSKKAG
jgi:flagellar hook-associated protein 2